MIFNIGPPPQRPDIVQSAYTNLESKDADLPSAQTLENLPATIAALPNPTNLTSFIISLGNQSSSAEVKTCSFTVNNKVNSIIMLYVGYMSSMTYNTRRVLKLIDSSFLRNEMSSSADRHQFVCSLGTEAITAGRTQPMYYAVLTDQVTYTYNTDGTTSVSIDLTNVTPSYSDATSASNPPPVSQTDIQKGFRFNGPYHIFAFWADETNTNANNVNTNGMNLLSFGGQTTLPIVENPEDPDLTA